MNRSESKQAGKSEGRLFKYLIYFIFIYAIASNVVCLFGVEFFGISFGFEWLVWLFTALLGALVFFLPKVKLTEKRGLITGFVLMNGIMVTVLGTFNTQPVSDYYVIYTMAVDMAGGNFDIHKYAPWSYEYLFNWQLGIAWIESLIFRLFAHSLTLLKLVDLALINLTAWLVYVYARRRLGSREATYSFLAFSVFYPVLICVGQFSNQIVVTPLILLFLLLIDKEHYLIAGVLLPIISLVRPIGIVLLLAVVILLIYRGIHNKTRWNNTLKHLAFFILPCVGVSFLISGLFVRNNLADSDIYTAKLSYFKFHQGLNIDSWEGPAERVESLGGDIDAYNEWEKNVVKEAYTSQLPSTIGNNFRKMTMFLGSFDWKFAPTYNLVVPEFNNPVITTCVSFGWAEYFVCLVAALMGYKIYRRRNGLDLFQVLFVGLVCVYFFIEAWPGYRYELYPFVIILAGPGLMKIRAAHKNLGNFLGH